MTAIADLAPGEQTIVISRVFDAPRELVFEAFTNPEHLAQFWGPKGFATLRCAIDLQVGGEFCIDLRGPDGVTYPCTGIYRDITPPERIVYAGTANDDNPCGAGLPPRSVVTMTFTAVENKTKLTIHTRLASAADRNAALKGGFSTGWNDSLDRLEVFLGRAD